MNGIPALELPDDLCGLVFRYNVVSSFPGIVMELTDKEVKEYLSPRDLCIGGIVTIYNRRFMIYDCDDFTKAFFRKNFGMTSFPKVPVDEKLVPIAKMVRMIYNPPSTQQSLWRSISF